MALLGKRNQLPVRRETPSGLYLDGGKAGEILLPGRYVKNSMHIGDLVDVFIYRDSEDRLVATTEKPRAEVGDFAFLKVVGFKKNLGAFLDWGLSKDLLLPLAEQEKRVEVGDGVVCHVMVDEKSDRIIASTRLNQHLDKAPADFRHNQPVNLLISGKTPLGFNAIVENSHRGLLYNSDLPAPVKIGQKLTGYVRMVREDGKIDLALTQTGYRRVAPLTEQILEALKEAGGHLALDDKSSPEAIMKAFSTSKKAFKQAVGALYKEHRIAFAPGGGIKLIQSPGANQGNQDN